MFTLNCKGRIFVIDEPVVMGIMNMTPDSFYSGSRTNNIDDILFRAEKMISDGTAILDIGGQSTRPRSERISVEEELKRVMPAIEAINKRFPLQILSIDTFYAKVAQEAINAGAHIVNDVSAGTIDEEMLNVVAQSKVPYVLMHMPGDPQTMQEHANYKNVTLEVFDFLSFKISSLIESGINDIIIDVGFGFGKSSFHNFQLLQQLSSFRQLQKPLLVGLSRKATIYKTLDITPEEALNGTTVLNTIALLNGASILRVHDVKEAAQAIKLILAYKTQNPGQ